MCCAIEHYSYIQRTGICVSDESILSIYQLFDISYILALFEISDVSPAFSNLWYFIREENKISKLRGKKSRKTSDISDLPVYRVNLQQKPLILYFIQHTPIQQTNITFKVINGVYKDTPIFHWDIG